MNCRVHLRNRFYGYAVKGRQPGQLIWDVAMFIPMILYRLATAVRNWLYDVGILRIHILPGYAISIGNIAVGGTGKTPVCITCARFLSDRGFKTAILTRGYKSGLKKRDSIVLINGQVVAQSHPQSRAVFAGDEPLLLSRRLPDVPIIVGRDRVAAAMFFLQACVTLKPTHWLLDDGFQHRRIYRHIDIVLLDARHPLGRGLLLPMGHLREPLTALRRASTIILTRAKCGDELTAGRIGAPYIRGLAMHAAFLKEEAIFSSDHKSVPIEAARFLVFCALGNPDSFRESVRGIGIAEGAFFCKPDHSGFEADELIEQSSACDALITTEKDYYRNPDLFRKVPKPVFVLPVTMHIETQSLEEIFSNVISVPQEQV